MHHHEHLHFLQQKIQELGSAIFFNLSDAVLKFPTALINNPKADDFGFVWAWVPRPRQNIAEFENGFPVRLDFYRKGSSSFLKVSGTAWIVTDPEELYTMPGNEGTGLVLQDMVPVKVKMLRAEYHEATRREKQIKWAGKLAAMATFFRPSKGHYAASHTYYPAA